MANKGVNIGHSSISYSGPGTVRSGGAGNASTVIAGGVAAAGGRRSYPPIVLALYERLSKKSIPVEKNVPFPVQAFHLQTEQMLGTVLAELRLDLTQWYYDESLYFSANHPVTKRDMVRVDVWNMDDSYGPLYQEQWTCTNAIGQKFHHRLTGPAIWRDDRLYQFENWYMYGKEVPSFKSVLTKNAWQEYLEQNPCHSFVVAELAMAGLADVDEPIKENLINFCSYGS